MKKLFITTALFLSALCGVHAQKNTVLVYGALDVQSTKGANDIKANSFSFSPGVGYQFTDHWTAGVNLLTSSSKYGVDEIKSSAFGAGPFVRYAHPLSDIFAVFGQFNANVLSGKDNGVKSNGFSGVFFPAIGVNMKNGFALNFNFGNLSFVNMKPKNGEASNSFGLSFGSGVGFGMSKNF